MSDMKHLFGEVKRLLDEGHSPASIRQVLPLTNTQLQRIMYRIREGAVEDQKVAEQISKEFKQVEEKPVYGVPVEVEYCEPKVEAEEVDERQVNKNSVQMTPLDVKYYKESYSESIKEGEPKHHGRGKAETQESTGDLRRDIEKAVGKSETQRIINDLREDMEKVRREEDADRSEIRPTNDAMQEDLPDS